MSFASLIRRNVVYPLWVAKDRSPRLAYLRELEKSQYYPIQHLQEIQFLKLCTMLEHAYRETAFYKSMLDSHGIKPSDIRDHRDLWRLPIVTKDDLRKRSSEFLADSFKDRHLSSFKTGGSTGMPVEILKDAGAVELINAASLRVFRWTEWNIGDAVGMVWGNPPVAVSLKEKALDLLTGPVIYLDTMNLTAASMTAFVEKWARTKPTMLRGHSHSLFMFASFCRAHGISGVRPRSIISSSMMLMPSERSVIEQAFDCKVTDLYGCEEVSLIASECEQHDGMHVDMENNLVEVVDPSGRAVAPGDDGAVVVTNLVSSAMPLVRYKVGDIASLMTRTCACGRTLPLMNNIAGRVADFLVRPDGGLVAGVSLVERTLTKFPGIAQMQIVQEDVDNITLRLVPDSAYGPQIEQLLVAELKDAVGEHNNIRIDVVSGISQEKSGKYRFAISRVHNPYS